MPQTRFTCRILDLRIEYQINSSIVRRNINFKKYSHSRKQKNKKTAVVYHCPCWLLMTLFGALLLEIIQRKGKISRLFQGFFTSSFISVNISKSSSLLLTFLGKILSKARSSLLHTRKPYWKELFPSKLSALLQFCQVSTQMLLSPSL